MYKDYALRFYCRRHMIGQSVITPAEQPPSIVNPKNERPCSDQCSLHLKPQLERVYPSYLELDLADVEPCISGPKRPHDRVPLKDMKADWHSCLDNKVGFKGFAVPKETQDKVAKFSFHGEPAELRHGSVVIAAITSCINTSNPSVMLGAGLVAKKACDLGLKVKPWIKTSLAPGSGSLE